MVAEKDWDKTVDQSIPDGYRIKPVATGPGVLSSDEVLRGDVRTGNDGH
jgi:hypothetical protein